jgi:glycosyltransferase involved in cell wall biosynthesis
MRIGINTLFLIPGKVGGSERYTREVLSAIVNNVSYSDIEFVIFANIENADSFRNEFASYHNIFIRDLKVRASNKLARTFFEQILLPFICMSDSVDLLWSPGYTAPLWAPCLQVVSIHDMQYKKYPLDFPFGARIFLQVLMPMVAARCTKVITVSEFSKAEILKYLPIHHSRIQVTLEGVDSSRFQKRKYGQISSETNSTCEYHTPYFLCVANTYPHKNVATLVGAFGEVSNELPHSLVLVGNPGRGEAHLEKAVRILSNAARVKRLYHVTDDELTLLYEGASAYISPSLYEGFGLTVIEAMAIGVPVIAAQKGSIPEICRDTVIYFDGSREGLVHAIRMFISLPPGQIKCMVENARERAEAFSWDSTAKGTIDCFKECLSPS